MSQLMVFTNNAATTLASALTSAATSLSVSSGTGALFPTLGTGQYCYCTLQNTAGTIEIVQVTARSTDTFTVVRGQDGTTAAAWNAGDQFQLRVVNANLTQFARLGEVNTFTQTQTFAAISATGITDASFTVAGVVTNNASGVLSSVPQLSTALGGTGLTGFTANGVVYASSTSALTTGSALTFDGTNFTVTQSAWQFYVGANFAKVQNTTGTSASLILADSTDSATIKNIGSSIAFINSVSEGMRLTGGNLLVGTTSVPSAFNASGSIVNSADRTASYGVILNTTNTSGTSYFVGFGRGNSVCGYIATTATNLTLYSTTSDQRLKTDLGTVTSTDVIANTVIHDFTWKSDGSQARGVFAQEAAKVLPAAVKAGDEGEEVSDTWAVDYSKYVPDIIVELQSLRVEL